MFKNQIGSKQDSIKNFSNKIRDSCKARVSDDFLIIARIESFILGKDVNDAIDRANIYISNGADGIMIHSIDEDLNQILTDLLTSRTFY